MPRKLWTFRTGAALALIFTMAGATVSKADVVIGPWVDGGSVGRSLHYLKDADRKLTIKQVANPEFEARFIRATSDSLNFGLGGAALWARFTLSNPSDIPQSVIVESDHPLFDFVNFYEPAKGAGFIERKSGDHVPFSLRAVQYRKPAFEVAVPARSEKTVYLRFAYSNYGGLKVKVNVWTPDKFHQRNGVEYIWLGIYYGAMVVMAFYNFFLFISVRDKSYFYYVLYIAGITLALFAYNGLAYQYLWGDSVYLADFGPVLAYFAAFFSATWFTQSFLGTRGGAAPLIDKILLALKWVFALGFVTSCLGFWEFSLDLLYYSSLITAPIFLAFGVSRLLKGYRPARFYVLSWSAVLGGVAILSLKDLGYLPYAPWSLWAPQVGAGLDVILLSFALADRINFMRLENETAQRHLLEREGILKETLSRSNDQLEELVASKTIQISTANEALRESESRFRELAEAAYEGIFIHVDGVTLAANRQLAEMCGFSVPELIGKNMLEIMPPQSQELIRKKIQQGGAASYDTISVRKDGSVFPVEIHSREIMYKGQKARVVAVRDITDQKEAEAKLRRAKEEAEEMNKIKDRFVNLISHDLRSPMHNIKGMTHILERAEEYALDDARKADMAKKISAGMDGLIRLIDDLFDMSRLQTGQIKPASKFFQLKDLAGSVIDSLSHTAARKGVEIVNDIPDGSRIFADPTLMGEVMRNLLTNALKFSLQGGKIDFFSPNGARGTFAVRDNGVGIDPSAVSDIFRPDIKTSTPGTSGEKGTGLGLPYCKDIVSAHGGEIWVESRLGQGSVFFVKLPHRKPSVLLVDDQELAREVIKSMLFTFDLEIKEAENGAEAIRRIIREPEKPDLVITDINMPEMDGFELLFRIKHNHSIKNIPVVVVTAAGGAGDKEEIETRHKAFAMGADDYVTKPLNPADFLPRVKRHVG
ncbi:MAG: response regulator [Nitrospinae bacterium]|nr:response regulator [Nitrospinota bacterium]